ncbi:Catabolite control protein A [Frondihabitans sp. 762G35]|uniref:LacI family DNA-binding transcriptional regulator n=1 Tax=Frondihabitans sp. 762G35 TaxID=1446794 RepID=UPI000D227405|nr:LacI family DNA-binding transcriptional regulator [Frondihabitans sp. 762G35]ARC58639.1 Catabolite control protein A [Frondihabitans sp. 762G35]
MASSKDVAERAGVSRSTVSQILNGHGHRFTSDTVTRVEDVAAMLGYRPSAAARTLVRGTSDVVITLIPNITFGARLRDFVDLLTTELAVHGLTNLLRFATNRVSVDAALLELRPRAIISLSPVDEDERAVLERHGVLVIEQSNAIQEHLDVAIGRRQAEHLASRGYETVVAAIPTDFREHRFAPPRASGVSDWALRNGVRVLPTVLVELTEQGARDALSALPKTPVGIAAYNDEVALALMSAAQRRGRSIPDDIGVIGVDNSSITRLTSPTISTMDFDLEFSAKQMVRVLVHGEDVLSDDALVQVEDRLKVVIGGSTARAFVASVSAAPA